LLACGMSGSSISHWASVRSRGTRGMLRWINDSTPPLQLPYRSLALCFWCAPERFTVLTPPESSDQESCATVVVLNKQSVFALLQSSEISAFLVSSQVLGMGTVISWRRTWLGENMPCNCA